MLVLYNLWEVTGHVKRDKVWVYCFSFAPPPVLNGIAHCHRRKYCKLHKFYSKAIPLVLS